MRNLFTYIKIQLVHVQCCVILITVVSRSSSASSDKFYPILKTHGENLAICNDDISSAIVQSIQCFEIPMSTSNQQFPIERKPEIYEALKRGSLVCNSRFILDEKISVIFPGTKQHLLSKDGQVALC
jgi:hypothetical protein